MTLMRVGVMQSPMNGLSHIMGEWTAPSMLLHLVQDTTPLLATVTVL